MAEWQGFHCDRSAISGPSMDNPCNGHGFAPTLTIRQAAKMKSRNSLMKLPLFYGMPGVLLGNLGQTKAKLVKFDFDHADYGKLRLKSIGTGS